MLVLLPPKVPAQQHCMKPLEAYSPSLYPAMSIILTFLQTQLTFGIDFADSKPEV